MNTEYFGNIDEPDPLVTSVFDRFASLKTQLRRTAIAATLVAEKVDPEKRSIVGAAGQLLTLEAKQQRLGVLVIMAEDEVHALPAHVEYGLRSEYDERLRTRRDELELPLGSIEHELYDDDISANAKRIEDLHVVMLLSPDELTDNSTT